MVNKKVNKKVNCIYCQDGILYPGTICLYCYKNKQGEDTQ